MKGVQIIGELPRMYIVYIIIREKIFQLLKLVMSLSKTISAKKGLKIPKGYSESVYQRRTDNTMAKRKSTKGKTTIYKT